jgi:triacylglycerol esterase/lipase EstA (alpha/beta hydrolase family)
MRLAEVVAIVFGLLVLAFTAWAYVMRALSLRGTAAGDEDTRLGLLDGAWAFAMECAATAAVLLLIPIGWRQHRCASGTGTRGPIILVHGWGLNRGSLWVLRHRLVRDGWSPVCVFEYATRRADIAAAAAQLREVITAMERPSRAPITLIGHSLGGLVLRYYARRYATATVRRLVTLGSPHQGTTLAQVNTHLRTCLVPGAAFITTLNTADRVPQQFDVIAIQSRFDALVLPPVNAEYPGAFNIVLHDVGHNMLLFSNRVYQLIRENLEVPLR